MYIIIGILSYLFIGSNFARKSYLTGEYEDDNNQDLYYFMEVVFWPLNILLYICKIIFIIITYFLEIVKKRNAIDLFIYLYNKTVEYYYERKC